MRQKHIQELKFYKLVLINSKLSNKSNDKFPEYKKSNNKVKIKTLF